MKQNTNIQIEYEREKTRISYGFSLFSVDLTLVKNIHHPTKPYKRYHTYNHKVEIKIIDIDYLRSIQNSPRFFDVIACFIDQIQTICKAMNLKRSDPDS